MKNKRKFWLIFPCIFGALAVFIWFFQWLWNALLPDILGVKSISYWQALGILLLSKILFGSFSFGKRRNNLGSKNCDFGIISEADKGKFREEWRKRFDNCK